MDSLLKKGIKITRYFYKKSFLNQRLQHDVIENGVAYIPCRIKSIDDVISKYSVKGCESLDTEFLMFIIDFVEFIPAEYPVVLQIICPRFSAEEKRIISDTIAAETDYLLGRTEKFLNLKKIKFVITIVGVVISGILLRIARQSLQNAPLEFFFVLFWLFADAFVRYLFIEKWDFREEKIHLGRLASMSVEFIDQDEYTASSSC
ncbi:MAG: hypothetical protein K6E34_10365 [Lachnospiraceae bacterium]|nr:hypothetical protein [Lachnospiraceae bacterium]